MKKLNKQFVSDIDQKLVAFNQTQAQSASQKAESAKYKRVFALRDDAHAHDDWLGDIWSGNETDPFEGKPHVMDKKTD